MILSRAKTHGVLSYATLREGLDIDHELDVLCFLPLNLSELREALKRDD